MASDSAVTVSGKKAFNGVDKIFHLDDNVPMGMMVNGPARFCGKSFKLLFDEFKCQKFTGDYSPENIMNNFIEFLEKIDIESNVENYVKYYLSNFKNYLKQEFDMIFEDEFDFFIDSLEFHEVFPFLESQNISFNEIIPDFVKNKKEINEKLLKAFSKDILEQSSEIIIAGFEESTKLPSYICFRLLAKTNGGVAYEVVNQETGLEESLILSFGDDREVKIFLNGIDPDIEYNIYLFFEYLLNYYLQDFSNCLVDSETFDENINLELKNIVSHVRKYNNAYLNVLKEEVLQWKYDRYISTFNLLESLPMNLLVEFAIKLIKFGSNKKKFSLDVENVGGKVNVAAVNRNKIQFFDSESNSLNNGKLI